MIRTNEYPKFRRYINFFTPAFYMTHEKLYINIKYIYINSSLEQGEILS